MAPGAGTCSPLLAQVVARMDPKSRRGDRVDLEVGDVVIVRSTDTPRGKWPLGRIVKVFPGKDNKVRVVDVQIGMSVLRRPIVKLCPSEHY